MKSHLLPAVFLLLSFLAGCQNNSDQALMKEKADLSLEEYQKDPLADTVGSPAAATSPKKTEEEKRQVPATMPPDLDKKIIRTASLQAEVADFNQFYRQLSEKVLKHGGYISSETQQGDEYRLQTRVVIRVPASEFTPALASLTEGVKKLDEKNISSQDLTAEYVDSRSRLEAKRQVRLRYLELLKGSRNMEEILNVQKEINSIQEEIELVSGRMAYISRSSALSTIEFTFYQLLHPSRRTEDPSGFGAQVREAFYSGGRWMGEVFIGLVAIWPLLLAIGLIIALYRRRIFLKSKPVR